MFINPSQNDLLKKTESETSIKASDEVTKLITEKKKPFTDVKETIFSNIVFLQGQ